MSYDACTEQCIFLVCYIVWLLLFLKKRNKKHIKKQYRSQQTPVWSELFSHSKFANTASRAVELSHLYLKCSNIQFNVKYQTIYLLLGWFTGVWKLKILCFYLNMMFNFSSKSKHINSLLAIIETSSLHICVDIQHMSTNWTKTKPNFVQVLLLFNIKHSTHGSMRMFNAS